MVAASQSHADQNHAEPSKRTLQNRKAQREFRERKASYVKSLEQRIRSYDSNEVQANVEMQRAARRYKEEVNQCRIKIATLLEQIRQLQEQLLQYESVNNLQAAMPPASRNPRFRGVENSSHLQQSQSPQSLYNQPRGFTAYDLMSFTPSFPAVSTGYPQFFARQVHCRR